MAPSSMTHSRFITLRLQVTQGCCCIPDRTRKNVYLWLAVCTFLQVVSLNVLPRWEIKLLSTLKSPGGVCIEWKYRRSEHEEVPAHTRRFLILKQPATETTVQHILSQPNLNIFQYDCKLLTHPSAFQNSKSTKYCSGCGNRLTNNRLLTK